MLVPSLPDEIWLRIFSFLPTCPRSNLRSLNLVSHRLNSLTHPLLYGAPLLTWNTRTKSCSVPCERLTNTLRMRSSLGHTIRALRMQEGPAGCTTLEQLRGLMIAVQDGLEELALESLDLDRWTAVILIPKSLRILSLVWMRINSPLTSPTVKFLSIHACALKPTSFPSSAFPSLETLALSDPLGSRMRPSAYLFDFLISLPPHLKALRLHFHTLWIEWRSEEKDSDMTPSQWKSVLGRLEGLERLEADWSNEFDEEAMDLWKVAATNLTNLKTLEIFVPFNTPEWEEKLEHWLIFERPNLKSELQSLHTSLRRINIAQTYWKDGSSQPPLTSSDGHQPWIEGGETRLALKAACHIQEIDLGCYAWDVEKESSGRVFWEEHIPGMYWLKL